MIFNLRTSLSGKTQTDSLCNQEQPLHKWVNYSSPPHDFQPGGKEGKTCLDPSGLREETSQILLQILGINLVVLSFAVSEIQLRLHLMTRWRWMWLNHVWGSEALPQRMKLRIWYLGRRGDWQTSSPLRWGTWGGPSLHLLLLLLVPSIQSIIWGKGHKLQTKDLQEHEASAAKIYVGLASSSDSLCFTFLIIRIKIFVWQFSLLNFVVLVCRHQIKRWRRSFDSKTEEKWSILLLETIRRWKKSSHIFTCEYKTCTCELDRREEETDFSSYVNENVCWEKFAKESQL